ncbi:hypothetical protein GUITHDRAFT_134975 [Guillardia theta CCMP2712]|uniref:Uncharacterized protein n=1 Tax=Guillardia theta (strain CCMP2712) TaxID=905079 RepID=L1JRS7_GUITC|nr:hypothetical protein GUITHDRAFT_134975 [Guillardia theta CCMP2712]EKX50880.1 hypothetical protein GUITHDRAFT_134975 [Guillardia theta CCMP2712]|eukprot:XP_005837860.1 hypothetical protein GUITHDRAFT_134975 [Guillardia theta CCMP2712]
MTSGYGAGAIPVNRPGERSSTGSMSLPGHAGYMYRPLTTSSLPAGNHFMPPVGTYTAGSQGVTYAGMGSAVSTPMMNTGFSHLSLRENSQFPTRFMPGTRDILTEDAVPDPVKHRGTSLGVEDMNGILPNDLLLSCAEAVWDALHYDGPKLTAKQKEDLRASKKTNIDDPGAEFVTFGEFLLWYEDSLERLTGPPTAEVPRPVSSAGIPNAYSSSSQYLEQAAALARLESLEKANNMYTRSSLPSSAMYAPVPPAALPQGSDSVCSIRQLDMQQADQAGSENFSDNHARTFQAGGLAIPANYKARDAAQTSNSNEQNTIAADVKDATLGYGEQERRKEEANVKMDSPPKMPEPKQEPVINNTESPAAIPADVSAESPFGMETAQIYACDHGCGYCGTFSEVKKLKELSDLTRIRWRYTKKPV